MKDLVLEVLDLKVSELEEPEPEVFEIKEVYLGKGAPELSQETQREQVSAGQWNLSLFWNPSGEKNTWESKRPLNKTSVEQRKGRL